MTTSIATPPVEAALPRSLGLALVGTAAFGAAAGLGHGASATLRGLWMAPALFVGGALLAAPPLYLASTRAGLRSTAEALVADIAETLGDTGLALLGLAAPAAFFSVTLHTQSAWVLLAVIVGAVGLTAVRSLARRTLMRGVVGALWTVFALALGVRLVLALSHQLPSH